MGSYRLSAQADRTISRIYEYSLLTFGEKQADIYFSSLHDAFQGLIANPAMGRRVEGRATTRKWVHRRHVIFYDVTGDDIFILDILGAGQAGELEN